jgi:hypothetical protein
MELKKKNLCFFAPKILSFWKKMVRKVISEESHCTHLNIGYLMKGGWYNGSRSCMPVALAAANKNEVNPLPFSTFLQ